MSGNAGRLSLLLICSACLAAAPQPVVAQTATPAQQLYGTWYSFPPGNPNTDSVRHEFRHNASTGNDEMIVTRLCPGDYRAVIARIVVPVDISANMIRIQKSVSDSEPGELNTVCQIGVEAAVMNYTVSDNGDRISIANPGGNPDSLELARQDVASEAVLPSSLYGTWSFPAQVDRGSTVQVKLVFYNSGDTEKGKVRQITTCTRSSITLTSHVDSPVKVAKNQITILQTVSHDQQDGPFSCKSTITAGTLHFLVSANGSTLSLSKGTERPLVLTRDPSAGLN